MKNYYVYRHIFPNEKSYIGISGKAIEKRWGANGYYYSNQPKIWKAICKYGWDNVRHEILYYNLDEETAKKIEQEMIIKYDSINDGYNSSIGGNNINTTYLCEDLLALLRKNKDVIQDCGILIQVNNSRFDKEEADYWNECYQAVRYKHKRQIEKFKSCDWSLSDWRDVDEILHEMLVYDLIYWLHKFDLDEEIDRIRNYNYMQWRMDYFSQKKTLIDVLQAKIREAAKHKGLI